MDIFSKINHQSLNQELQFQTARSGGPGGQHVNKVNSKVLLRFNVPQSSVLDEEEKAVLLEKLSHKLDQEGNIVLQSQESRSQIRNKEIVVRKFYDLFREAFQKRKIRKVTRPGKAAKERRLKDKKALAAKKQDRKKDW